MLFRPFCYSLLFPLLCQRRAKLKAMRVCNCARMRSWFVNQMQLFFNDYCSRKVSALTPSHCGIGTKAARRMRSGSRIQLANSASRMFSTLSPQVHRQICRYYQTASHCSRICPESWWRSLFNDFVSNNTAIACDVPLNEKMCVTIRMVYLQDILLQTRKYSHNQSMCCAFLGKSVKAHLPYSNKPLFTVCRRGASAEQVQQ